MPACSGQWQPELLPDDPRELGLFAEFAYACTEQSGLGVIDLRVSGLWVSGLPRG